MNAVATIQVFKGNFAPGTSALSCMALSDRTERDKRLLEHLVKQTVHAVLFEAPESPPVPTPSKDAESTLRSNLPVLLQTSANADEKDTAPFCVRVMTCQHWSDVQLANEKTAMKKYLREQAERCGNQRSVELSHGYEAYALLKLFQSERNSSFDKKFACEKGRSRFLQLLHIQLVLYAKYFEQSHHRKVRDRVLSVLMHGKTLFLIGFVCFSF